MIHYNTKATFENFENTNKSKVDCAMIQNKKEEEKTKHIHIHTQNKKSNKNKKQKHAIKIIYQILIIQSFKTNYIYICFS